MPKTAKKKTSISASILAVDPANHMKVVASGSKVDSVLREGQKQCKEPFLFFVPKKHSFHAC